MPTQKKRILYLEDDPESVRDYYAILREKYEVIIGAHRDLLEKTRTQPVDLVIVDLMIHHYSSNAEDRLAPSISFQGINWQRTGVEFIRRLRAGEYEIFGLPATVPVIVATAVVDYAVQEQVLALGVEAYKEKPFTLDEFDKAVKEALEQ